MQASEAARSQHKADEGGGRSPPLSWMRCHWMRTGLRQYRSADRRLAAPHRSPLALDERNPPRGARPRTARH
eukprot:3907798-Prymnesium_polylepis.1